MHTPRLGLLIALATFAGACASPDSTAVLAPPTRALTAHTQDLTGVPDLIVDAAKLASSWVVYDEFVPGDACSAIEGEVPEGDHRLLRFTVTTPNIGTADVYVGDPNEHVRNNDGLFEFATCHAHFHFRNYATYELFPVVNGSPGTAIMAAKRGFCMLDITPYDAPKSWYYRNCGRPAIPSLGLPEIAGNQGISVGWGDTYVKFLPGQYFVVDGLPAGEYLIRITVNPPFAAVAGEPCPAVDGAGKCHMFVESDYSNNVGEVLITLPANRPGKQGWGPGGNDLVPNNLWTLTEDEDKPKK